MAGIFFRTLRIIIDINVVVLLRAAISQIYIKDTFVGDTVYSIFKDDIV